MKKLTLFIISLFIFFTFAGTVRAQMGMMGSGESPDLDSVLSDILKSQNINSTKEINCAKTTDEEFEKLGDAWMEYHVGNEAMHERMDDMMGGEGSEQLKNTHIQMGKNYLGCSDNGVGQNFSMMNGYFNATKDEGLGGMMGDGKSANHMFSGYKNGWDVLHVLLAVTTWLTLIAFLLSGTRYFWKNTKK